MPFRCFFTFFFFLVSISFLKGQPYPWQLGFQEAATPIMEQINDVHNLVLKIIFGIGAFVAAVLVFIIYRFRRAKNPVPSKRTHNTALEIIWTLIPFFLLILIAVPSFKLMFYMDKTHDAALTVKVTGQQFLWNYAYADHDIDYDSHLVQDADLKPGQPRLLSVDEPLVVPINTNIRLLYTSTDVIHSWAVPAFGIKMDCVPGRLNENWVHVKREGLYYGQCSELCGANHGFMPITVKAVSPSEFKKWLDAKKNR